MKTISFSILAAIVAWFLPVAAVDPVARLLAVAIALMASGVFPCMTLTVGAMKGERRTPALVNDLYTKLELLMKLLVVAFALAVVSLLCLVVSITLVTVKVDGVFVSCSVALSAAALSLLGSRVVDIGRAFFALLEINRRHALLIARAGVRSERDDVMASHGDSKVGNDDPKVRKFRKVAD